MTAESRRSPARRFLTDKEAAPIKRDFRRFDAQFRLLEREWDRLLKDHENEWVAVYDKEFLFADTLEALIEAAREKGWPLGMVTVDHLITYRPAVLL